MLRDPKSSPKASRLTWINLTPVPKKNTQARVKTDPQQRVVQTENERKVLEPKKNAYLGFQNQTVDRQTVSRNKTITSGKEGHSSTQTSHHNSERRESTRTLRALGVGLPARNEANESGPKPEWATPGTRPQDSLLGIAESDRTALNTQEFVFYGYFQRIRSQLDKAWNPILREKLISFYKQGRTLASDQEHLTQVLVVLNELGEITRVQVMLESGMIDLDDAAIAAFRKAGPFPNPPKGMSDPHHEIKIAWDFILKT